MMNNCITLTKSSSQIMNHGKVLSMMNFIPNRIAFTKSFCSISSQIMKQREAYP